MFSSKRKESARSGQAILETCLAMLLICLLFAGLVQVSQLFAARDILQHAATSGARAKTVGFNQWMVEKVIKVAAIPNSGKMLAPSFTHSAALTARIQDSTHTGLWDYVVGATPSSEQYAIERARIPAYLGSWNRGRAAYELDYERWHDGGGGDGDPSIKWKVDGNMIGVSGSPMVNVKVSQNYPLWTNWHEAFYAGDSVSMVTNSCMENHYPLYLDDQNR
jgi:hypothetical protein